jgi:hypothetical protein
MNTDYIKGITEYQAKFMALVQEHAGLRSEPLGIARPRGCTAFEIRQRVAEAQSKLSEVQRALRPQLRRTELQMLEEAIEYMFNNPFYFDMGAYVELKWQLARAQMREDLQRIIEGNRMKMAVESGNYAMNLDLAKPGSASMAVWPFVAARYFEPVENPNYLRLGPYRFAPIRVDRNGNRL